MTRMNTIVLLVVVFSLFSPCHGRRSTEQRQLRRRLGGGSRALGPIKDAFLNTIDELTKPDDTVEENETTGTPTSAPTVLTIPTIVPTVDVVLSPSSAPSSVVVLSPSSAPSSISSSVPSDVSSSDALSNVPSSLVSNVPSTILSNVPSTAPSDAPSIAPSTSPSGTPVILPSDVPSLIPTAIPSVLPTSVPSDLPSIMPTSGPSEAPSIVPSDTPSVQPSTLPSNAPSASPSDAPSDSPSDAPSTLPSDVPSNVPSTVPSSMPSNILSSAPSGSPTLSNIVTVTAAFSEDEIAVFESTCTQFLYDYLPLVQPNTYSNLDCKVTSQTAVAARRLRRQLQNDAAVVPFRVNDVELLVEVTGDAPGETNFSNVVSQTFETFGTELKDSLTQTSDAFSDSEGEGDVVTPEGPAEEEITDVTRPSTNSPTLDWTILGSAIAGGVCLALIVSLLLVKNRSRRHTTTPEPAETKIDLAKSKSFSVSSVRDGSSFREYSLIKLVSIEASRSLAKNEGDDDGDILPPTPLGVDTVPGTLLNSPEEIKSELSPSSFFGDLGCCNNNIDRVDTDMGNVERPVDSQYTETNFDRNSTYMTGVSSTAMMTNETATKIDDFMSSQSDSSDLEGLHLANTNTFSNLESKGETEQQVKTFNAQVESKRRMFSFRPTFLKPKSSGVVNSNHQVVNDSTEVEEDCCATDNWTVRTNSILTPRKANTTANGSVKGQSGSFE